MIKDYTCPHIDADAFLRGLNEAVPFEVRLMGEFDRVVISTPIAHNFTNTTISLGTALEQYAKAIAAVHNYHEREYADSINVYMLAIVALKYTNCPVPYHRLMNLILMNKISTDRGITIPSLTTVICGIVAYTTGHSLLTATDWKASWDYLVDVTFKLF